MARDQQITYLQREVNSFRQILDAIKRKKNIETITLKAGKNILIGNFYSTSNNVCVECNAEDNSFDVVLPDAKTTEDIMFRFRKSDTTSNPITIKTLAGQTINSEDTQVLTSEGDNMPLYAINGNWKIA